MNAGKVVSEVYGMRVGEGLRVWAWRQAGPNNASSIPRQAASGADLIPYSCRPGQVSSWVLWYDVLCDATGDPVVSGRLAGLLDEEMSAILRAKGELNISRGVVLAWVALRQRLDAAGDVL